MFCFKGGFFSFFVYWNMNSCRCHGCIRCCLETEMALSNRDIERIKNMGFDEDFFVIKRGRWLQLRNEDGRCVFHDGELCTIYEHRPEGCRLYPLIHNGNRVVLDKECPYKDEFEIDKGAIKRVHRLIKQLEHEKAGRSSRTPSLYSVYILRCSDERRSLYTGYTRNLERRLREHQKGRRGRFTRGRRPVHLVYSEEFSTRKEAMKREAEIKCLTRAQKLRLIGTFMDPS
jgi:predicted GIY-YIG superfamily endonuclease/Fe-S-cluster containining protein